MAWLRIDDRVRTHPKIGDAGPAAAWLWFCGICYCREHLTDGFIPKSVVTSLAMNLPIPWKHAEKLVNVRLWHKSDGGFQVHDFLDWNPSRHDVMSLRDKERDKKRTQRGHDEDTSRDRAIPPGRDRAGDAGLGSGSGSGDLDPGIRKPAKKAEQIPSAFQQFWEYYPRKDAKKAAEMEWVKQRLDRCAEVVIAGLRLALASRRWREAMLEPEMPHVPHARTWLHQRRWEDEASQPVSVARPAPVDWEAECKAAHAGRCSNRHFHAAKMADEQASCPPTETP